SPNVAAHSQPTAAGYRSSDGQPGMWTVQSAVSKIWTKYKQHGIVVKGKRTGRPRKTSKHQDKQLKAICLENRKITTKQMNIRNRLKDMGFQYRKAKRKPALTPKHKRTRLQWAKERQSWTVDDWMKVIFSDESRISAHVIGFLPCRCQIGKRLKINMWTNIATIIANKQYT
uniref:Transposase Tc1-like domain-containing protein n=1 Tax=Poecilia reticulata TaxID=8081 RepID=A0A3P9N3W9_POERE